MPTTDQPKLFHILLDPALRQELEDYRYAHRFPTLAEAARSVFRLGLDAAETRSKNGAKTP